MLRRAFRGSRRVRTAGHPNTPTRTQKTIIWLDNNRCTGRLVSSISSQGVAKAAIAASRTGKTVKCEEDEARIQTISADVSRSAERMAAATHAASCFEIVITS